MRTTLDIDDDVLAAAKELAAHQNQTAGKILSNLARRGIQQPQTTSPPKAINGFELLPADDRIVTPRLVEEILDEPDDA